MDKGIYKHNCSVIYIFGSRIIFHVNTTLISIPLFQLLSDSKQPMVLTIPSKKGAGIPLVEKIRSSRNVSVINVSYEILLRYIISLFFS